MVTHSPARLGSDLADTLRRVRDRDAHRNTCAVPTGFAALDRPLGGGLRRGEVTLVAGRGGMGVTMFVLGLLRTAAVRHGLPSLALSPGQDLADLHLQLLSAEARIPLNHLRYGPTTDDDWAKAARSAGRLETAPIWLDTTEERTATDVRGAVDAVHAHEPLALVIVDGLEDLQRAAAPEPGGRVLTRTFECFRAMARRHDLAVVLTCRLDRSPRPDHYPSLAELPEDHGAGDIDAIADTILLLHRDDVYDRRSVRPGEADVIIARNRGPTYAVGVHFQGHYARFVEPVE